MSYTGSHDYEPSARRRTSRVPVSSPHLRSRRHSHQKPRRAEYDDVDTADSAAYSDSDDDLPEPHHYKSRDASKSSPTQSHGYAYRNGEREPHIRVDPPLRRRGSMSESHWARTKSYPNRDRPDVEYTTHRRKSSATESSRSRPKTSRTTRRRRTESDEDETKDKYGDHSYEEDSGSVRSIHSDTEVDGLDVAKDLTPELDTLEEDEASESEETKKKLLTDGADPEDEETAAVSGEEKNQGTEKSNIKNYKGQSENVETSASSSSEGKETSSSSGSESEDVDGKELVTFKDEDELVEEIRKSEKRKAARASKMSRRHRRGSHIEPMSDRESAAKARMAAPSPPLQHEKSSNNAIDSDSEAPLPRHKRRSSHRYSTRSRQEMETSQEVPLSGSPRDIPQGIPTSDRHRRTRRSKTEYSRGTPGSYGSDHRGSFSGRIRPESFSSRHGGSGTYERPWAPSANAEGLSQSPGDVMHSESEDEDYARSHKHRNSRTSHSGTPPKAFTAHRRSSAAERTRMPPPPVPEAPSAPGAESEDSRRTQKKRTKSTVNSHDDHADFTASSPSKARRPSKHQFPEVPMVPGDTDTPGASDSDIALNAQTRTEFVSDDDEEMDEDEQFPKDMDDLESTHSYYQFRDILADILLDGFRSSREFGIRRPRGNSRVDLDGESAYGSPGIMGRRQSVSQMQRCGFACPFPKYDAELFMGCGGFIFDTIEDLGKHLKWCHRFIIKCARCCRTFANKASRDEHLKADPPCENRNSDRHNGICRKDQLRVATIVANTTLSPQVRWHQIYSLIFPDAPVPVLTPDLRLVEDMRRFQTYTNCHAINEGETLLKSNNLRIRHDDLDVLVRMATNAGCFQLYQAWFDSIHTKNAEHRPRERGPSVSHSAVPPSIYTNAPNGPDSPSSYGSFSSRTPVSASWQEISSMMSAPLKSPYGATPGVAPPLSTNRRSLSGIEERDIRGPRRASMSRGMTMPSATVGPMPIQYMGPPQPVDPYLDELRGSLPKGGGYYGEAVGGIGMDGERGFYGRGSRQGSFGGTR